MSKSVAALRDKLQEAERALGLTQKRLLAAVRGEATLSDVWCDACQVCERMREFDKMMFELRAQRESKQAQ